MVTPIDSCGTPLQGGCHLFGYMGTQTPADVPETRQSRTTWPGLGRGRWIVRTSAIGVQRHNASASLSPLDRGQVNTAAPSWAYRSACSVIIEREDQIPVIANVGQTISLWANSGISVKFAGPNASEVIPDRVSPATAPARTVAYDELLSVYLFQEDDSGAADPQLVVHTTHEVLPAAGGLSLRVPPGARRVSAYELPSATPVGGSFAFGDASAISLSFPAGAYAAISDLAVPACTHLVLTSTGTATVVAVEWQISP